MRRKAPPTSPPVFGVRLYLEDIRTLYDEIASVCGGAQIETDEYELDGPDDLLNLGRDRLSPLTLRGDGSNVFVYITNKNASVG